MSESRRISPHESLVPTRPGELFGSGVGRTLPEVEEDETSVDRMAGRVRAQIETKGPGYAPPDYAASARRTEALLRSRR